MGLYREDVSSFGDGNFRRSIVSQTSSPYDRLYGARPGDMAMFTGHYWFIPPPPIPEPIAYVDPWATDPLGLIPFFVAPFVDQIDWAIEVLTNIKESGKRPQSRGLYIEVDGELIPAGYFDAE